MVSPAANLRRLHSAGCVHCQAPWSYVPRSGIPLTRLFVFCAIAPTPRFLAAQIALFTGFLPAFMLSGFLYEIDAMPAPIRAITRAVPARYFVDSLKTVFLAGDIWAVFLPNLAAMAAIGALFFAIAKRATRKNLE